MARTGSLLSLAALVHLLVVPLVHADPSSAVPMASPEKRVVAIMKGQPAPFSGILVPELRFDELIRKELLAEDLQFRLDLQIRTTNDLERMFMNRLVEATKPPKWYDRPSFNRWLGWGLGVLTAAAMIWAGHEFIDRLERQ